MTMVRPIVRDTIPSQLPQHIVEQYPNFVEFLESYYAWLNEEGNPYERVKHHMDYVTFAKSLDEYKEAMMKEFLSGVPSNVKFSKETLIEWSRKLNMTRGSHESYKFLFKILFDEQDTEIYLPKDNILRTSDGRWISNQYAMIVTNPGDPERLQYRKIVQSVEVYPGTFEHASATVESLQVSYAGRFNTVILTLINVVGDFKHGYPITVEGIDDVQVWPVKTVVDFIIEDGGTNFFRNEHIVFDGFDQRYIHEDIVLEDGKFDTRISTIFTAAEVKVFVDGEQIVDFHYDGQHLTGKAISIGSHVRFEIPQIYIGTMKIGDLTNQGSVRSLLVEAPPVGIMPDIIPVSYDIVESQFFDDDLVADGYNEQLTTKLMLSNAANKHVDIYKAFSYSDRYYDAETPTRQTTSVGLGRGLVAYAVAGVVRKIPGYYADNKGWLSGNMYLQDNDYYQEYSYEIKTEQQFTRYADIVKRLLHPSGFKMFGNVRIYSVIESLIKTVGRDTRLWFDYILTQSINKYAAGSNFNWIGKAGPQNTRYVYKNMNELFDPAFLEGDPNYNLEDVSIGRTLDERGLPVKESKRGWMAKNPLSDFDVWVLQDYVGNGPYGGPHAESLYVGAGEFTDDDESEFINKYIAVYISYDYTDPEYA